jgi:hypothetical protein
MAKKTKASTGNDGETESGAKIEQYQSSRELAAEVFRRCDAAGIAIDLLQNNKVKNGAVRARIWENLIELYYGQPKPSKEQVDEGEIEVVWDIAPLPITEPQH